jgi:predicted transcriptional regulator
MGQGKVKVITVRLAPEDAHRAEMVARVDEISVNEVFRQALEHYLALKQADAGFMARAKAMVARDAEIVGGLR